MSRKSKSKATAVLTVIGCEPLRVTMDEAAILVRESKSRLYGKIRDGHLRVTKEGSKTVVTMTELRRYVSVRDPVNRPLRIFSEGAPQVESATA